MRKKVPIFFLHRTLHYEQCTCVWVCKSRASFLEIWNTIRSVVCEERPKWHQKRARRKEIILDGEKNMSQKKIVWRVYITFNSNEISLDPFLSTIYTVWFSFVSRSIFYWSTGSPYVWAINCVFVLVLYAMRVIRIKMVISALISNLVMVGNVNPNHWFNGIYARCNTILFYPNTHTQSPITSSSIES